MAKDTNNGANLGFESEIWRAADALRSNMDTAEYKRVVLGLIFLKYISDTFHRDLHPDLKADFNLANPPFNMSDWGGERLKDDQRWKYGILPAGNTNFAWVQHFIHHLAPTGLAGFVLANGSMSSNQSGEGEIRKIADTYHAWRGDKDRKVSYQDVPGLSPNCASNRPRRHGWMKQLGGI